MEAASKGLIAEIADHVLAQQINSAPCPDMDSKKPDVRVSLTNILWRMMCSPPEMAAAYAAFQQKCKANNLDPRDLLITSPRVRRKNDFGAPAPETFAPFPAWSQRGSEPGAWNTGSEIQG
jgi:hypothetical protein